MVVCRDEEVRADLLDVLWGQASVGGEVVLDAAVLVTKQLQKGEHRVMSRGITERLFEGARNRRGETCLVPASEHIQRCFRVGREERHLREACHDHLPCRLATYTR